MENTIIVIGSLGDNFCYLNIPKDQALRRYVDEHYGEESEQKKGVICLQILEGGHHISVKQFNFSDQFWAYDICGND